MKRILLVLIVVCGLGVPAASAQAASLVFLQDDGNVYLANADGSGIFQVTLDGDPSDPYGPPSQADDGTIVTTSGDGDNTEIIRMTQNGTVLSQFKPPFLFHGDIIDSDVSPDGTKIAYTSGFFGNAACNPVAPPAVGTTACVATRVASSAGADLGGPPPGEQTPSWMSNTRLLIGDMSNLRVFDVGGSDVHWFGPDGGVAGINDDNPDDGDWKSNRLAAVTGGAGNHKYLMVFSAPGASTGVPSAPTGTACQLSGPVQSPPTPDDVFRDPSLSSDGIRLAWEETDNNDNNDVSGEGIWIWNIGGGALSSSVCTTGLPTAPAIPFGHYPDFGPANVNPAPRPAPGGGGGGGGNSGGAGNSPGGGTGSGSSSSSSAQKPPQQQINPPLATGSGAADKAVSSLSIGTLQLTLMAPGSCVPVGQNVNLAVTSAIKKAITKGPRKGRLAATARKRRKPKYKIKQVTFSLDATKTIDKAAAFTTAFPSTGLASGSRHSVGAAVALKKGHARRLINKSLSGSIAMC